LQGVRKAGLYDCTALILLYLVLDENVLFVIGGDVHYKDEDEKEKHFLSDWARKAISHQFRAELLDGRRSFILSWNKKHRPVHEGALLHYFDPNKKGQKFVYNPKPEREAPNIVSPAAVDIQQKVWLCL